MALEKFMMKAVPAFMEETAKHLGDQSGYVGSSDIGCPRRTALDKREPAEHDLKSLFRLARGHAAQELISGIFKAGKTEHFDFEEKVELVHPHNSRIRCHVNFLFKITGNRLHLVLLKSVKHIPQKQYANHVDQLHLQLGLAKLHYPSHEIGGSILYIDLNDGVYKEFNSYKPDDEVFDRLVKKAEHILACMDGKEKPIHEPSQLCGSCNHRSTCPSHQAKEVILPADIAKLSVTYAKIAEQHKMLGNLVSDIKGELIEFTGNDFCGKQDGIYLKASVACSPKGESYTKLEVKISEPSPLFEVAA